MMNISFVDLKAQYNSIKSDIDNAIQNVLQETAFIRGKYVKTFEEQYQAAYGVKHCIGVGNGTDAIYIILKMLGIGQGDEVITVANSWISTSETITQAGAKPIFIDIERDYFTIASDLIEAKITSRTKAIIPVHLCGQMADMVKIKTICEKYSLFLIEDCAQAHFSQLNGQNAGTFGDAATFSFYPGKNLGAYGDAGAIITNNDDLAEKCRMYANHGALVKHHHFMEGINSRLDGLQASILSAKLPHLDGWIQKRQEVAQLYSDLLKDIPEVTPPLIRPNSQHTFHLYMIRAEKRDELRTYLNEKGIPTFIHYPTPLPFMPAYGYLRHTIDEFPVASAYQCEILSLPMFPELSKKEVEYIVDTIKSFYKSKTTKKELASSSAGNY